jgi:hypothetical protein
MVYLKANGSGGGFSWEKQLRFLLREQSDNFAEIISTKLNLMAKKEPENADYYEKLNDELSQKLTTEMKANPEFGFDQVQEIANAFVREHNIEYLLEELPLQPTRYWCYKCEDFTKHLPMENGSHYCLTCHSERISALSSYINTSAKTLAELIKFLTDD